jgi:hypothetical protein
MSKYRIVEESTSTSKFYTVQRRLFWILWEDMFFTHVTHVTDVGTGAVRRIHDTLKDAQDHVQRLKQRDAERDEENRTRKIRVIYD